MNDKEASLSLDLDNLWTYMKTHGDAGWESFPSYLDVVVPRFLALLEDFSIRITVFVVGQDAALERNHPALRSIVEAGHEIGNHSFSHEPWLHLYSAGEVAAEISRAEAAIESATGIRPRGFRGPGYSVSETVLNVLNGRGYHYDCSTFPTFVGPLARTYYFLRADLDPDQRSKRTALFGGLRDGLRPITPYLWRLQEGQLIEIPVTTLPLLRAPIHFSYLHWLAGFSEPLARSYFSMSMRICDTVGAAPSLLLHPLDFLGRDDIAELAFFPGMNQTGAEKMERMRRLLAHLSTRYTIRTMGDFAARIADSPLPTRLPDFEPSRADPGQLEFEGR